jgi:hypothetical protein
MWIKGPQLKDRDYSPGALTGTPQTLIFPNLGHFEGRFWAGQNENSTHFLPTKQRSSRLGATVKFMGFQLGRMDCIWKCEDLIGCSAQIWPMKSAYSAIQGFDWVPVSRVVWIIKTVTINLRAVNPYQIK